MTALEPCMLCEEPTASWGDMAPICEDCLSLCYFCAPWPCCGAVGHDHAEDCAGESDDPVQPPEPTPAEAQAAMEAAGQLRMEVTR